MVKKYILILVLCLFGIYVAHAQVNPQDQLNALNLRIQKDMQQWQLDNSAISSDNSDMVLKQADADAMNQEITISQESVNAIETAIASAQANTDAGVGLTKDPNAINWTDITDLHLQGLNWSSIQAIHSGVNWTAVNIANGTSGVNWSDINWNVISNCLSKGVNWNTAVINGTC
jgi:hypothetical protein